MSSSQTHNHQSNSISIAETMRKRRVPEGVHLPPNLLDAAEQLLSAPSDHAEGLVAKDYIDVGGLSGHDTSIASSLLFRQNQQAKRRKKKKSLTRKNTNNNLIIPGADEAGFRGSGIIDETTKIDSVAPGESDELHGGASHRISELATQRSTLRHDKTTTKGDVLNQPCDISLATPVDGCTAENYTSTCIGRTEVVKQDMHCKSDDKTDKMKGQHLKSSDIVASADNHFASDFANTSGSSMPVEIPECVHRRDHMQLRCLDHDADDYSIYFDRNRSDMSHSDRSSRSSAVLRVQDDVDYLVAGAKSSPTVSRAPDKRGEFKNHMTRSRRKLMGVDHHQTVV